MTELTDKDSVSDEPASPAAETEVETATQETAVPADSPDEKVKADETADSRHASVDAALADRLQRIRKVPVSLIVQIAERRMALQQLREIAPGTLLMFDKPCDSLLDVFVNNRLYCRGEAVKVGESFGIKISECNAQVVREKKVHQI